MRLPSGSVWTLSLTPSAENGEPLTTRSELKDSSVATFTAIGAVTIVGATGGVAGAAVCATTTIPGNTSIKRKVNIFIVSLLKVFKFIDQSYRPRHPVGTDQQVGLNKLLVSIKRDVHAE